MQAMNLLVIPSWYDTPDNPVRGLFFKEQAHALLDYFKKNEIDATVTIIALQQYNIKEIGMYSGIKKINISKEDGITTVRARMFHFPKLEEINFRRGAVFLKKLILQAQKLLGIKFDLIHIHSTQFSGIWYAISKMKIPYVITEHSSAYFRNRIGATEKKYLPAVFDNAKSVIAVGNGLAKKIQVYSQKDVKVVFNIVKEVPRSTFEGIKQNEVFTFFSLGYDIKVKGFDVLLNAFARFLEKHRGVLVIGGLTEDGQNALKEQAKMLGINNSLELLGRIPHDEVYKYMARSSCFVLPSRFETFGIVLAESMYVGRPVIASRTGGPDSFVNESNGILVEPGNEDELFNALVSMKENYTSYNSSEMQEYAARVFSADAICERIYNIYKDVLVDSAR